ncbi:hypothetical protein AaE_015890 [Aphanomyces astaci]|uniref:SET domain-containing protein n=1 Tax=Aphanomyces astaci TaxID=112090 RepID=A0A6A4YUS2_APHAT|nr:hypothetical protein AaE_015890 [Aphanomyces astaci]
MTFQDGTSMKLANRDEYGLGYKHIDICCEPIATTGRPPRIAKFSRGGKYQRGVYNESCTRCNAMSPCVSQRLCDNVMTYSECASGRCSAGLNCRNNAIQRRRYPKTTVVECPKLQYALRLEEDVVADTKINEYVGERIGKAEFMHRKAHDMGGYLATVSREQGGLYIDAMYAGNESRLINHSCVSNCVLEPWFVDGEVRLVVVASRHMQKFTVLSISYMGPEWNIQCLCNYCDGSYNSESYALL